jgi:hypothetical protein
VGTGSTIFLVDCFGGSRLGGAGQMIISDLVGTGTKIFSSRLFWWQPTDFKEQN